MWAVRNLTIRAIEQYKLDFAIIGCSSIDEDGDLLDFDIQEVNVTQMTIRQARKGIPVADYSKFQCTAQARFGSLREVNTCITDRPFPHALSQEMRRVGNPDRSAMRPAPAPEGR